MSLPTVVADASVLIALHHLSLLPKLSVFYHKVLVPSRVRSQFLTKGRDTDQEVALTFLIQGSFFVPCDDYDSIQVDLYLTYGLDHGEAEALSQAALRNADAILIDERRGREVATRQSMTVRGTIGILARFDRLGFVKYTDCIRRLREGIQFRVSDTVARQAYDEAKLELG